MSTTTPRQHPPPRTAWPKTGHVAGLLALGLVAMLPLGACSLNPLTRQPRLLVLSQAQESQRGEQAATALIERHGVLTDSALTRYVAQLGRQMAELAPGPAFAYRFEVLDVPEANAVAFPGGRVLIGRGFLPLLAAEAELAGILAHEVGHVALEHAAERLAVAVPMDALAALLAAPVELLDEAAAQRLRDALPMLLVAPYNRRQEREADLNAALTLASWGLPPLALGAALTAMDAEAARRGQHAPTGWVGS